LCWSFTDGKAVTGTGRAVPSQTALSTVVSKELKGRGFKFVGPTIVYAWMQAVGIVNDHSIECFRRLEVTGAKPSRSARNRKGPLGAGR
jgi:DNA-3-methyladenine glycosylase I